MRRLTTLAVLVTVLLVPSTAQAQDSLAPDGAPAFWLPDEEWSNLLWLPFDEARLYKVIRYDRGDVFRWTRIDATNTIAQLARRRGLSAAELTDRLVAPRKGRVSAQTLRTLRSRTRRVVTQGHLGQHILFHALHQTAVADRARSIFGVRRQLDFLRLRRAELSPLQIGELYGRTRVGMRKGVDAALVRSAARGVRLGYLSRPQADVMLDRQLRQVPRWLGQKRYNGPSGGRNQLQLPPGDVAKHPTLTADGTRVVWDGYRTTISQAERLGEIHVAGADLKAGRRFAISPKVRPGSRRPHSAYNSVISADGRVVAFETAASTFPLAKRVGQMSVLVRDLTTGKVEKVSHASRGKGDPTRTAFNPSISADGRHVAYEAVDSATARSKQRAALVVFDRSTGTERTVAEHGEAGAAFLPELSADGAKVAYTDAGSSADGRTLVYVQGVDGGERELVSRASGADGAAADSDAYEPAVSRDASVIAFTTRARNLGTRGARSRVYVRDLVKGTTELVSGGAGGEASEPAISPDGRFVAFVARARFAGGSLNRLRSKIWLHDRQTHTTTLVSRRGGRRGGPADGYASEPSISSDGNRVAFVSTAGNLTPRKGRGLAGVFVRDLTAATTTLISSHSAGRGSARAAGPVDVGLLCQLDGLH